MASARSGRRKILAEATFEGLLTEISANARVEFDRLSCRRLLLSSIAAGHCFRCNDETPSVKPVPDIESGFLAATRFLADALPGNRCSPLCVECWYSWVGFRGRCWYHLDYRAVATANASFDDIDIMLLWLALELGSEFPHSKVRFRFPGSLRKALIQLKKRDVIQKEPQAVDPFDRLHLKEVRQFFQHNPELREVALFEHDNWKETSRLRKALGFMTFEEAEPHKRASRQERNRQNGNEPALNDGGKTMRIE